MRSVRASDVFGKEGGTEMGFMSTTEDLEVAVKYAIRGTALLFKMTIGPNDFMVLGANVQWLSAFPAEREYLYPPLTYLSPTGKKEVVKVASGEGGRMTSFTVIGVEPRMG
uniref:Mono(ADP-ribosyl)transferase n=2 Tax=Hemiselmis andersenii TaxID=464988 RepID=A0A7S0XZ01_HEMAN|mmetsp:Transcript_23802/g.54853  ORF Transcript_23802/g.54853 Transcript_23802/m.54853 type:complete len:111 (+) Transcript_23802:1-333(+)